MFNKARWTRYASGGTGYEVSSRGDRRFSALYARLTDGNTIEKSWQNAKGSGKGRPAVHADFDYWAVYLGLWERWAEENPALMKELQIIIQSGKTLTDCFASTANNQARALAAILNTMEQI
jgi:hypothetical protein